VFLHDKKGLSKKDKKMWCYDNKFLVHLKEFASSYNKTHLIGKKLKW